jgi:hypothetical protein
MTLVAISPYSAQQSTADVGKLSETPLSSGRQSGVTNCLSIVSIGNRFNSVTYVNLRSWSLCMASPRRDDSWPRVYRNVRLRKIPKKPTKSIRTNKWEGQSKNKPDTLSSGDLSRYDLKDNDSDVLSIGPFVRAMKCGYFS